MKRLLSYICSGLLCVTLLTGCGTDEPKISAIHEHEESNSVTLSENVIKEIQLEIFTTEYQKIVKKSVLPARVVIDKDNEALLGSLIAGRVYQVYVKAGDYVQKGEVVMLVEGLQVGELKSGYVKAKAALTYAKANYERQKKLLEENIGSLRAVQEYRAEYEKALADYEAEDKKIHSVGLHDHDISDSLQSDSHISGTLPIKSPISGIAAERNVVLGQYIDNTTNAFRIINTATVWIDGQVNEHDLEKIQLNSDATFTSSAYPGKEYAGKVIYISGIIDENTRTVTVRCSFVNKGGMLKPQMFGELHLNVNSPDEAIMVPEESIIRDEGVEFVFISTNSNTFERRMVETGYRGDGLVEIKTGLSSKEKIVTKGAFFLKSELKKDEISEDAH